MTLALLLLFSMSVAAASGTSPLQTAPQSAVPGQNKDQNRDQNKDQSNTQAPAGAPQAENPPSSPATAPVSAPAKPAKAHPGTKHPKKRVKQAISPCTVPPSPGSSASATSQSSAPTDGAAPTESAAPSTDCPPKRTIVRQGGTAEPSIQLAGGDQDTEQQDKINQMLGSAEGNLKRISSSKLDSNQRDVASQTRQFIDQSRNAMKAGDLERARTLAWKAQLLSQELVNPQQ